MTDPTQIKQRLAETVTNATDGPLDRSGGLLDLLRAALSLIEEQEQQIVDLNGMNHVSKEDSLVAAIEGDYSKMSHGDLVLTCKMLERGRAAWRKEAEELQKQLTVTESIAQSSIDERNAAIQQLHDMTTLKDSALAGQEKLRERLQSVEKERDYYKDWCDKAAKVGEVFAQALQPKPEPEQRDAGTILAYDLYPATARPQSLT